MSGGVGPGRPPLGSRFRKGVSGNPKGRPRKRPEPPKSAFAIVLERTLEVRQGGTARELTIEEALQQRTYEDALAGNRAARREVLKMIAKREKWLAARAPGDAGLELRMEWADPTNANEAVMLLGIAERDARWRGASDADERLLLCPWAVEKALSRGRRKLSAQEVSEIKRCTRDADTLRWPSGMADERDE